MSFWIIVEHLFAIGRSSETSNALFLCEKLFKLSVKVIFRFQSMNYSPFQYNMIQKHIFRARNILFQIN